MGTLLFKKMTACAIAGLLTLSTGAQVSDFEQFAHIKGVEYIHVNKGMIEQAEEADED